jgi:acyl carrier protein
MKIEQLNQIILKSIEKKSVKNFDKLEWDSLSHLNILSTLEKKFPKKISSIKGIADFNNYKNLSRILIKKKLIK